MSYTHRSGQDREATKRTSAEAPLAGHLAMLGNLLGVDRCPLVPASPPRDGGGIRRGN